MTGNHLLSPIDENPGDGLDQLIERHGQLILEKNVDSSMNDLPMFASNGLVQADEHYDANGVIGN